MRNLCFSLFIILLGLFDGMAITPGQTPEKPPIPPDLSYEFKPVPVGDNAIINWRRAAQVEVPLEPRLNKAIFYCWTPEAKSPSDTDMDALRSWVRREKDALDLFEDSLLKPKAQWPDKDSDGKYPESSAMFHLVHARLFIADSLAQEKKFTNAVESLEKSLKLTQLGLDGDPTLFQYVLVARERTLVQGAMVRLAARRELPMPLLERLLKDLPSLDSETNAYARILRVAFIRSSYHSTDVRKLAETWAKIPETSDALLYLPDDLHRAFKVLLDPTLVALHPKPLDENAAINDDIRHFRIFRTNSVSAWSNRNDTVQAECEQAAQKLRREIGPLMEIVADEPLPLSRQAAERARGEYLRIYNPVGRIASTSVMMFTESDAKVFECRTEREAARAVIGLLVFERQKGMLPWKLSDLVSAKILDSVPFDFFANAPISYARDRRIVWSVGENGVDDGGQADEGRFHWYPDDAVWQIPKIN